MLKVHEVIRPPLSQSFFRKAVDLWLRRDSGHIGADMYHHHNGQLNGKSMSGATTWSRYAHEGLLPILGERAFLRVVHNVAEVVGSGISVLEFGPGFMKDAQTLIGVMRAKEYIPIDCSVEAISHAKKLVSFTKNCIIRPAITDFLSERNVPLVDKECLGVLLGLTLGNLSGALTYSEKEDHLVKSLRNLSYAMPLGGYFLTSIDTCMDEATNVARYNEPSHRDFSINHLYRMAEELPMHNFDPNAFEYCPIWDSELGVLTHNIIATRSQKFEIESYHTIPVSVEEGEIFHCDNSFKYSNDFFEACAEKAGMAVVNRWQDEGSINMYLLRVAPQQYAALLAGSVEYEREELQRLEKESIIAS